MKTIRGEDPLTVGELKARLADVPNDYAVSAYEGEGIGLNLYNEHGAGVAFIHADPIDYRTTDEWAEHEARRAKS